MDRKLQNLSDFDLMKLQEKIKTEQESRSNPPRPRPLDNPDFTKLIQTCEACIDDLETRDWWNEDNQHYVYESAFEAIYGKDFFSKYLNQKTG